MKRSGRAARPRRQLRHALRRASGNQRGITLAEVLVAAALLTIGMVAVLSGMTIGLGGVERSGRVTTALFLAEQRLEQVRSFAVSSAAGQGFANLNAAAFPAEAYNTIAGSPAFRRVVTITPNAGGNANLSAVRVQVFYRSPTAASGAVETSTLVDTVVTRR